VLNYPSKKYNPFRIFKNPGRKKWRRTWPDKTITKAPIFLSTDLRDGNQSIEKPMDVETKLQFFDMLVGIGFKEIEVGFPSASETEMRFVRKLIEGNHIPDDVSIQVLTQARDDLIPQTIESVKGAKKAIVHMYAATDDDFMKMVLQKSREEVIEMVVERTKQIKELTDAQTEIEWALEFSPEHFTSSDISYAHDICDAVTKAWEASPDRKVILNMPATVECCLPNVHADQIEWMSQNLARRDSVVISVHPHNDMGMSVAAAMMALLAGADRIEGCLFGNGERTGNVPTEVVALNLYANSISPGLDFSNMDMIARKVEIFTGIPVPPRHPYAGEFVFTAWSGSHQDAIKKGLERMREAFRKTATILKRIVKTGAEKVQDIVPWKVPYLHIDPADIGRSYEALIRVNSQSGKGGVSHVMKEVHGIALPRGAQKEFSRIVQEYADTTGAEVSAKELWSIFDKEYLDQDGPVRFISQESSGNGTMSMKLNLEVNGEKITVKGEGNGPIDAAVNALNLPFYVKEYDQKSIEQGSHATALTYIEMAIKDEPETMYGFSVHQNTDKGKTLAIISSLNRAIKQGKLDIQSLLDHAEEAAYQQSFANVARSTIMPTAEQILTHEI
jgi:2-isopropylmalate synthase